MRRLVLFDIDGTLLHGGALWRECFEGAFKKFFPDHPMRSVSFNGKTDPQICHELLDLALVRDQTPSCGDEPVRRIIDEYLSRVEEALPLRSGEVVALPGTHDLLKQLSADENVRLGLLTGNVVRGARCKLRAVGMDHYFDFGVYGDDHWDRYQLPRIASEKAHQRYGVRYSGREIVVIGDTIHDVCCGKSIGVRSIAVGTGRNVDRAELLAARPDYFFENLTEIPRILRAISEP